jgi:hypothetical protein
MIFFYKILEHYLGILEHYFSPSKHMVIYILCICPNRLLAKWDLGIDFMQGIQFKHFQN